MYSSAEHTMWARWGTTPSFALVGVWKDPVRLKLKICPPAEINCWTEMSPTGISTEIWSSSNVTFSKEFLGFLEFLQLCVLEYTQRSCRTQKFDFESKNRQFCTDIYRYNLFMDRRSFEVGGFEIWKIGKFEIRNQCDLTMDDGL